MILKIISSVQSHLLNVFVHVWFKLTEREKQVQEERRKLLEKKKLEDQEKARIKAQVTSSICCMLFMCLTGKEVKQISKLDWTFNLVVIINWMRYIFCSQIEADRKNSKDREIRESVRVVIVIK